MSGRISVSLQAAALLAAALTLQASRSPRTRPEPRDTPETITAAILRLEQRLDDAESRHQAAAVDELIADDYSGITVGGGVITKKDVLAAVAGHEQASSQSTDRQVRALDNAAVYTALVVDRGTGPKTGEPYLLMTRVMDVWQKRGRDWKLVNDQATTVPFDHLAQSGPPVEAPLHGYFRPVEARKREAVEVLPITGMLIAQHADCHRLTEF